MSIEIVSIEKHGVIDNIKSQDPLENRWIGYKILMNDPTKNIDLKMDNTKWCCEQFGIYTNINNFCKNQSNNSANDISHFIGAKYLDVIIRKIEKEDNIYTTTCKINITVKTDKGNITFCLYNDHNGYYKHQCVIDSEKGYLLFDL